MMSEHKYCKQDFLKDYPEWKRKKDPLIVRYIFRPISFYFSSFCANHDISANEVSVFSVFIGLGGCILFLFGSYSLGIVGACIILLWLLLDCIDGNLARTIGHQPFGDFVDALSSYTLVAFIGVSIGTMVFRCGGLFVEQGNPICIIVGAIASTSDTLMRLAYQKYRSNRIELEEKGIISKENDIVKDHDSVNSLLVRIEMELGMAGVLPVAILVASIFGALDIVILYMFFYYTGSSLVMISKYVKKAMTYKSIRID